MKVLVAGASGLIGHAAIEQFQRLDGWDVVGVSRSVPDDLGDARLLALDLTDAAACRDVLADVRGVTHVVYAALQEGPGLLPGWYEDELIERNGLMERNLFDALDTSALEHVSLLQGTKAYGVHHPTIGADGGADPAARAGAAGRAPELLLAPGGRPAGPAARGRAGR